MIAIAADLGGIVIIAWLAWGIFALVREVLLWRSEERARRKALERYLNGK